jgi:hypothetical protein
MCWVNISSIFLNHAAVHGCERYRGLAVVIWSINILRDNVLVLLKKYIGLAMHCGGNSILRLVANAPSVGHQCKSFSFSCVRACVHGVLIRLLFAHLSKSRSFVRLF